MEAARFDNLGVFTYSDEDSSASYKLDGKVNGRAAQARKRRLMATQRKIARARNRALVGSEVSVLVEGASPETDLLWQGRMPSQAPEIDGAVYINDGTANPGDIVRVLFGEILGIDNQAVLVQIIATLAITTDPKEQARLLGDSSPILWGDMPTLPLYRQQRTVISAKKMYAVEGNPTKWGAGWNMDRWVYER